jgi:hypothetical protein
MRERVVTQTSQHRRVIVAIFLHPDLDLVKPSHRTGEFAGRLDHVEFPRTKASRLMRRFVKKTKSTRRKLQTMLHAWRWHQSRAPLRLSRSVAAALSLDVT